MDKREFERSSHQLPRGDGYEFQRAMPSNYNFRYFVSFARVSLSLTTLDGGSQEIPSFSQLAILEEVLSRIAFDLNIQVDDAKDMRPADFFELFAGTGFGGYELYETTCAIYEELNRR